MRTAKRYAAYRTQYAKDHYKRLTLYAFPDEAAQIEAAASAEGKSVSLFLLDAAWEHMTGAAVSK